MITPSPVQRHIAQKHIKILKNKGLNIDSLFIDLLSSNDCRKKIYINMIKKCKEIK